MASSPRAARDGVGVAITPSGQVSVMPQICSTSTPYLVLKASAMARGTALPPITTRFRLSGRWPVCFSQARYIVQMVGTPPVKVTPSPWISSCSDAPSILSAGSTSLEPQIGAVNGRPQAVAW
jgi:hypothetical protein